MPPAHNAGALLLGLSHPTAPRETLGFSKEITPALEQPQPITHSLDDGPLLVFGRTSSGKGTTSLIPICLQTPPDVGMIIVDCKGEISAVTADFRRKLGAQVHIVDPWGITTDTPSRFNPLDLIGDPFLSPSAADDAMILADALVVESSRNDRFWDQAAKGAIAMGCLLLAGHAPQSWRNLGALSDALGSGTGSTLSGFLAAGLCSNIAGGIVRREAENLASLSAPTLSSITGTLASHLRPLTSPLVKRSMAGSDIDLDAITKGEPSTIYLVIPASKMSSHRAITRTWLNTFVCAIARRQGRPIARTVLLVDELAQLGPLEAIRTVSFLLRGYGLSLAAWTQTVDQLARLYPDDWRALIDNAGTIVSLTGGTPLRRLAEITIGEDIARTLPDLPAGDAAVIKNGGIQYFKKQDYRDNPSFAHLAELNPFFSRVPAHAR